MVFMCEEYKTKTGSLDGDIDESLGIDRRFVCPKCDSTKVKLRPFFGSVSVCQNCKHTWNS
jgi:hypothetical protein